MCYHFIGLVVGKDEAIVQKEPGVTLPPVRVEYLFVLVDFGDGFNHEPFVHVTVAPNSLFRGPMVEHVGQWHKRISLDLPNGDAEDTTAHRHPGPTEILIAESAEAWLALDDGVVVPANVATLLFKLLQEVRSLEFRQLILRVVEGEVVMLLWQNLNILFEW